MAENFMQRCGVCASLLLSLIPSLLPAQCKADFSIYGAGGCGHTVTFAADSSDHAPGTRYLWDFGDGSTTHGKPVMEHTYRANGGGVATFTVTLTVFNGSECRQQAIKQVILKETPDVQLEDTDPYFPFTDCGDNPSDSLHLVYHSLTADLDTHFELSFGDGSSPVRGKRMPEKIDHYYPDFGLYQLKLSVTGQNGCVTTVKPQYFKGWNPGVPSLEMPPLPSPVCGPHSVTFRINGTGGNSPGTQYIIYFSDSDDTLHFSHPPPPGFTHIFTKSSCGYVSQRGFKDAFDVTIVAKNPCGEASGTVEPIRVSTPPVARVGASGRYCLGELVTFSDIGSSGYYSNQAGTCSDKAERKWAIAPATGWTLTAGALNEKSITIRLEQPGSYEVGLSTGTPCGKDAYYSKFTVVEKPVARFDFNPENLKGCLPVSIQLRNNSQLHRKSRWKMEPATGWKYDRESNAFSENPRVTFLKSGTYIATLEVQNDCATAYYRDTIVVEKESDPDLEDDFYVCADRDNAALNSRYTNCGWSGDFITSCGVFQAAAAGVGVHMVYLTRTTEHGCHRTDSAKVHVLAPPDTLGMTDTIQVCRSLSGIDLKLHIDRNLNKEVSTLWEGAFVSAEGVFTGADRTGTHRVTLIRVNKAGCRSSSDLMVQVDESVIADAGAPQSSCLNASIRLKGNPEGGVWSAVTPGAPAIHPATGETGRFSKAGVYRYRYTLFRGSSCESSDEVDVTVAGISANTNMRDLAVCETARTVDLPPTPGFKAVWRSENLPVIFDRHWKADISGGSPGIYPLSFDLTDTLTGCNLSGSIRVRVLKMASAGFRSAESGCVGEPIRFKNLSTPHTVAAWSFGDSQTSSEWDPVHVYTEAGTYRVTIRIYHSEQGSAESACVSQYVQTITIDEAPRYEQLDLTVNPKTKQQVEVSGGAEFNWKHTTEKMPDASGKGTLYLVKVKAENQCGEFAYTLSLYVKNCNCKKAKKRRVIITLGGRRIRPIKSKTDCSFSFK